MTGRTLGWDEIAGNSKRPVRKEVGRVCLGDCGTILRSTNTSEYCGLCTQANREIELMTLGSNKAARRMALERLARRKGRQGTRVGFTVF